MDIVETKAFAASGMVLVDREGHVWHTFYAEWHEVGAWIRWYLTPGVKKWVMIAKNNKKYRVRAVRLSKSVIYLGK